MKGLGIKPSKKLVFAVMGGIVVLGGGSGAAAVFVGTDKMLGPSYLEINGLSCTTLDTVKIKRDKRYWVRKYVVSDEPGDGMARIRTALRVAKAVQEKEKADLVQVAMLDKAGPKDRAQMRGRVIGAQVIYMPDVSKAPEGTRVQPYSAYYLDGAAGSGGEYFGMRVDLPLEDVETLTAKLTDKADCVDPVFAVPADAHGAPAAGHGEKPKGNHGETPAGHGEVSGRGEASGHGGHGEADGHHAAPAAGDHAAPAEGGKRWSKLTEEDATSADAAPETSIAQQTDAAPSSAGGPSDADAAGKAWLEKFRAQSAAPQPNEAKH